MVYFKIIPFIFLSIKKTTTPIKIAKTESNQPTGLTLLMYKNATKILINVYIIVVNFIFIIFYQ